MDLLARPKLIVSRWPRSPRRQPGSCGAWRRAGPQMHEVLHLQPEPHSPRPLGLPRGPRVPATAPAPTPTTFQALPQPQATAHVQPTTSHRGLQTPPPHSPAPPLPQAGGTSLRAGRPSSVRAGAGHGLRVTEDSLCHLSHTSGGLLTQLPDHLAGHCHHLFYRRAGPRVPQL